MFPSHTPVTVTDKQHERAGQCGHTLDSDTDPEKGSTVVKFDSDGAEIALPNGSLKAL